MKQSDKIAARGKEKILNAAESLFATEGYYGASLRGITRAAGVELGLSSYHFRSKDELYRQVLRRRAPAMAYDLTSALSAKGNYTGPDTAVRRILAAYAGVHFAKLFSADSGWRSYVRLAAQAALLLKRVGVTNSAAEIYTPVIESYKDALAVALPRTDREIIDRQFYVFQMSLFGIVLDVSGTDSTDRSHEILHKTVVDIFAAAFCAAADEPPRR